MLFKGPRQAVFGKLQKVPNNFTKALTDILDHFA